MEKIQLTATQLAIDLIKTLQHQFGELLFHHSSTKLHNTSPLCFKKIDVQISATDELIGEIAKCPIYVLKKPYIYEKNNHFVLDVVKGKSNLFSLEARHGCRFILKTLDM